MHAAPSWPNFLSFCPVPKFSQSGLFWWERQLQAMHAGHKERVSRPEVTEAARFAKYAIAAYGAAGFQYLHQTS